MKKIFITIFCLITLLACLTIPCLAAEGEELPELSTGSTTDVTAEISASEEYNTIFTRLWEFIENYKVEIFIVVGDAILAIMFICSMRKNDKRAKDIADNSNRQLNVVRVLEGNQNNVVEVINNLIDSYNNMAARYAEFTAACEKYGATEEDRNKVIGALVTEAGTVLDILSTVYVHNKVLPQGTKDLVNIKYASCLKKLEDECGLASIIDAVHAALNKTETRVVEEKESTEV
jgi:hypothetical protein